MASITLFVYNPDGSLHSTHPMESYIAVANVALRQAVAHNRDSIIDFTGATTPWPACSHNSVFVRCNRLREVGAAVFTREITTAVDNKWREANPPKEGDSDSLLD